jgi:hypothetical protein
MSVDHAWRRVRRRFSISAPRMSVRTHLGWPWRAAIAFALVALVGGMWWWGFDFGQIFGAFHYKETERQLATARADVDRLAQESAALRLANSALESELAMTRGAQATLSRQVSELTQEAQSAKEELAFLQKLVADSSKQVGLSIPRLVVEKSGESAWHYSVLVVRGGTPRDDFVGRLALTAILGAESGDGEPGRQSTLLLPEDRPDVAPTLKLRFKYYQRIEGIFRVPSGTQVRSLTVRAYEDGSAAPRAARTLALS